MTRRARSAALMVAALLMAPGCTGPAAVQPPPAATTPRANSRATLISDFDGDGAADIVIGAVGSPAAVQVRYASGRVQAITRSDLDGTGVRTRFGASILARDMNADGYADLVIADRGDDETNQALFLVAGSAEGLKTATAHRYLAPRGVGRFGSALALVEEPDPVLVVGAPYDVAGGYVGGVIVTYHLGVDGLPKFDPEVFTQDSAGMPAKAERGDWFGASLAASGSTLLIGVPLENVGTVPEAGAVILLNFTNYGFEGRRVSKASAGVPGAATAGDLFGASLDVADGYVAVGVPGHDAGRTKDVGRVQPFTLSGGTLEPLPAIDQAVTGVAGDNEPSDAFGTAVAIVRPCPGVVGALVGAPAEGVAGARAAGAVWVIPFVPSPVCPARTLDGTNGLGPTAVAGKRIGSAVAGLRSNDPAAADEFLVAAPGDAASGGGTVWKVASGIAAAEVSFTGLSTPYGISLSPAR